LFNLEEPELRRRVLEPWSQGRTVSIGDREWDPAKSRILILEGRRLEPAELAVGQGWNNARRNARDVTLDLFRPAQRSVVVVADTPAAGSAMASLLADLGLAPVEWDVVRARALAGAPEDRAGPAVVVMTEAATPATALEAGLALGAFGERAILVLLGTGEPLAAVEGVEAIRVAEDEPDPLHALAERLQRIGCQISPAPGWAVPGRLGP
jgi:hypothetical protein